MIYVNQSKPSKVKDGSKPVPSFSFVNDPDTGLFRKTVWEILWVEVWKIEDERRRLETRRRNHYIR